MRVRGGVSEAAMRRGDNAPAGTAAGPPRVLIGGVGYRWQRDASFGLVLSDTLATLDWPAGTDVQDLGYGAIYAAQDIAAARPDRLILLAAVQRGRAPGRLYRRAWSAAPAAPEDVQDRIREAGAGVVDLDHLLVIAQHFGALPKEVVVVELEPVETAGGEELSPAAAARLNEATELVRREALAARRSHAPPAGAEAPW